MEQEVDPNVNDAQPEVKAPEVDVESLMARMEKLEATNSRLLEESKMHKSKYQGLRSEVEEKEKASLTENEQWKELLEMEKNKRSEYEAQLKETKKSVLKKELNFKVASVAKDAYDVNDIISSLPRDILAINEEDLTVSGVEEAVNRVRESKPWLFEQTKKHGMASSRPNSEAPKEETFDDKINNDVSGALKDVLGELLG